MNIAPLALRILVPLLVLMGGAMVAYIYGKAVSLRGGSASRAAGTLAVIVIAVALIAVFNLTRALPHPLAVAGPDAPPQGASLLRNVPLHANAGDFTIRLAWDRLSSFLALLGLTLGLIVSVYSVRYMEHDEGAEKFFPLLLLMIAGLVGIAVAADLFSLWVFFELMCVSSYVLVAFRKENWEPVEAGVKYLVMSAAGSMLVLLAISYVFFQVGALSFEEVAAFMRNGAAATTILPLAILFVVGFGVKSAVVPLHTWLPDAHAAAPSGISAMLSGIVIEAGFIAMLKTLLLFSEPTIGLLLIILALLTMTLGNVVALVQTDLKRMLAYSSVAQMGYILLGVGFFLVSTQVATGLVGGLFHVLTHAFMKAGAFLCAGIAIHALHSRKLDDMRGLSRSMPVTAACFTVAALSLAGVPPFSGFMSKWIIYRAGVDLSAAGIAGVLGLLCTLVAVVNSVISLGYYLPAIQTLYARDASPAAAAAEEAPGSMLAPVVILAALTLALGLFPDLGLRFVTPAAAEIGRFLAAQAL